MHELSICQSLLHQVAGIANQHHAHRVMKICVKIGPLSGIEPGLLKQAFSIARSGTIADDAELVTEHIPVRIHCPQCNIESSVVANRLLCDACGGWQTSLISGDEMVLASVEIDKQSSPGGEMNYV